MMGAKVTLGATYRDTLTGYEGVAIARAEYIHDAPDVKLQRLDNDGRPEEFWFNEARLAVTGGQAVTARTSGF